MEIDKNTLYRSADKGWRYIIIFCSLALILYGGSLFYYWKEYLYSGGDYRLIVLLTCIYGLAVISFFTFLFLAIKYRRRLKRTYKQN